MLLFTIAFKNVSTRFNEKVVKIRIDFLGSWTVFDMFDFHRSHDFKVWALKDIRRLTHIFFIQEACLAIFFNYGDGMGTLWVDILNWQKSQHIVIKPKIYGWVFDQPSGNTCISMSRLLGYSFKMLGNKPYIRLARASVELLHSDIV